MPSGGKPCKPSATPKETTTAEGAGLLPVTPDTANEKRTVQLPGMGATTLPRNVAVTVALPREFSCCVDGPSRPHTPATTAHMLITERASRASVTCTPNRCTV